MRTAHILIIEEHSALPPFLSKTLEADGMKVVNVQGSQNALKHANEAPWSLIIIDQLRPGPQTAQIVSSIKSTLPQTPLLILIESIDKSNRDALKKLGVDECLVKPFAFQEFLTTTKELLQKNDKHAHEITLDDLTLDTKNNVVKRNGRTITLTKKEYSLLTFLMKHCDHAVSRQELLEHVWGMQIDPLSNTIEAHILSLRHKIDAQSSTKLIHTVPKFGYRMSIHK